MLTVQPSSGLYFAVQYTGLNGPEIATALRATDYQSSAGQIRFKSFIMRTGGLLTSGHQFTVAIGQWVVWAQESNTPYVIAPPLSDEEFAQQYQVAATAADIAALQAEVAALDGRVDTLDVTMGAVVTTVNIHTGQISDLAAGLANISATQITSGILPPARLSGTIPENATVVLWNRPTLADPPTAADSWQWLYNGNRTVYGNEYNLLRVRGVPEDQVVARFMSNFARDGLATAILQATLSNGTSHMFQVLGNGDILAAGGLSMLPTAPVAVAFNAAGLASAPLITDGSASTGAPYPVTTTLQAANNRVFMSGSAANTSGVSIPGGTLLFTINAAHVPAAWVQFTGRTSTTLSPRITIRGNTGQVYIDQALAAGATLSFDGLNYRKA